MKNVLNVILVLVIIALGYACFASIQGPIEFDRTRKVREKEIIKELIDIRTAQVAYKQEHNVHAKTFDELRNWLQNGTTKTVRKQMELSEDQLKSGLTESQAVSIVKKAEATGNWTEAEEKGLSYINDQGTRVSFTRDTIVTNALSAIFGDNYDLSTLGKVPGTNAEFEMDTASVTTASGYNIKIFQAQVPYTVYLGDLNKGELSNLIDKEEQFGRYPGLRVGSLTEINNNAGNWE